MLNVSDVDVAAVVTGNVDTERGVAVVVVDGSNAAALVVGAIVVKSLASDVDWAMVVSCCVVTSFGAGVVSSVV